MRDATCHDFGWVNEYCIVFKETHRLTDRRCICGEGPLTAEDAYLKTLSVSLAFRLSLQQAWRQGCRQSMML